MAKNISTNNFEMIKRHVKYMEDKGLLLLTIYHPGEYIEEYMTGLNLSIQDFSKLTHLSNSTLKSLLLHQISINESIALKLEAGTHISKKTWLNLQKQYDEKLQKAFQTYNKQAYDAFLIQHHIKSKKCT